jgi:hypothetical protein
MKSPLKPVQSSLLVLSSNATSPLRSSAHNGHDNNDNDDGVEWHVTFHDDNKPAAAAKADSYFYPTDTTAEGVVFKSPWFHTSAHRDHYAPVSVDDYLLEYQDSDDSGFADCDEDDQEEDSDSDDPVASQLQEWNVFASFDPILIIRDDAARRPETQTYPIAAAVASVLPSSWLWNGNNISHNHASNSNSNNNSVHDYDQNEKSDCHRRRRVRFQTDENGAIACTKYDDCSRTLHYSDATHWTDEAIRNVSWYGRADFLAFRSWFHETVATATVDAHYRDYFLTLYHSAVCHEENNDNGLSSSSASLSSLQSSSVGPAAIQFSKYRGLERAIFRNELQTDKIAALKGVVWSQAKYKQQQEEYNQSLEAMAMGTTSMSTSLATTAAALARTSAKLTATARFMALVLGAADATVATTLHQRDATVATATAMPTATTTASRRFVEI